MKRNQFILLVIVISSVLTSCVRQEREMCFADLVKDFDEPSNEFRPVPLWVWNADMKYSDVDRMLEDFKDKGFGGVFIHPRPGLETEYLGQEWFDLWEYSLEKGKELGLDIWIYDENSYPAGFAGGHVPNEMPESYNQGQTLKEDHTTTAPAPGDCYMCLLRKGDEFQDITSSLADYQGVPGDYYVYRLGSYIAQKWTAGFPYVDLMVEGVTEKFIDVTMRQGYEKHFGKDFGKDIKGMFSDEPSIECPSDSGCRWTPELFPVFKEMWGYDLSTSWPMLGNRIGDWKKVRHNYNSALLHLFIERWSRPMYEYCESHNLSWTGHYWEHNWPDMVMGPDNMAMYAWHQIPGVDLLFNQFNDSGEHLAQFGNVRIVKEARSVSNQMGRVRTLSESYGCGGWDETFIDFKRITDWQFALGVNFLNQHLSHTSITGIRKFDCPPVFTSVSPWWESYGEQNAYYARLSMLLSQGEQRNDWLLIEPTTTAWMHYTHFAGPTKPLMQMGYAFQSLISDLEKQQMECDLGCEDIIKRHGSITSKCFTVGECDYQYVVIPPLTENLDGYTFNLLKEFVNMGGRIFTFAVPTRIDGTTNEEIESFFSGEKVERLQSVDQLIAIYRETSATQILPLKGDHVYHFHNSYDDGELFFIVNSSLEEEAEVSVSIPGKYLYRLDAMTGEIFTADAETDNECVVTRATLPPAGSLLFFASHKPVLKSMAKEPFRYTEVQTIDAVDTLTIRPVRDNAMTLDFCKLNIGGKQYPEAYHRVAESQLWGHFGRYNPWESAVQFRREILDSDTFEPAEVIMDYTFVITEEFDWKNLCAIIEKPELWQVAINGQEVSSYSQDDVLDSRCGVYSIGQAVKLGVNTITLSMPKMNIRAEVAPVILRGKFVTIPAEQGFTLGKVPASLQLGNYAVQGYHFYSWDMAYEKSYDIKDMSHRYEVTLGEWNGTVSEVWVNGQKAGIIAYPPYQLDVTSSLREGINDVEVRVIGSLANLYGPHYESTPGFVHLASWSGVENKKAGADYILYPYGLEDDFRLQCKK